VGKDLVGPLRHRANPVKAGVRIILLIPLRDSRAACYFDFGRTTPRSACGRCDDADTDHLAERLGRSLAGFGRRLDGGNMPQNAGCDRWRYRPWVIGPTSSTLADLSIASVASTKAMRSPRVSIIPSACCDILFVLVGY